MLLEFGTLLIPIINLIIFFNHQETNQNFSLATFQSFLLLTLTTHVHGFSVVLAICVLVIHP